MKRSLRSRFHSLLRISAAVVPLLALPIVLMAGGKAEHPSQYFVLDNGLRVFLLERPGLPLVHIAAAVDAGSKDECADVSGLSHLLEHYILFRGTETRTGEQVTQDIRRHGAYVNAHTGHDVTLFVMTLPSEHAAFGLENQKDILFNLEIDAEHLEEEKAVLLDEIRHMEDDPLRFGTALLLEHLFQGHPYALPVQGRPEAVQSLAAARVREFYERRFVPGNTGLAIVGDFRIGEIEPHVRRIFGAVPKRPLPDTAVGRVGPLSRDVDLEYRMDVAQAYLFLGFRVPGADDDDRHALEVLTEILGRGVHPLLHAALRGRRNLVHSVSVNYLGLSHGGALMAVLTLDQKNLRAAKREIRGYLRRLWNETFSPEDVLGEARIHVFDVLGNAKNQIRLASEKAREDGLNMASALARHILTFDESRPTAHYLEKIQAVRSTDLRRVAAENLSRVNSVSIALLPMEEIK